MGLDSKGDYVRPQVVAVMDLLLAGIVIDCDFTKKFDDLINLTDTKCDENGVEMQDFYTRMYDSQRNDSIPCSLEAIKNKIKRREEEVTLTHSLT